MVYTSINATDVVSYMGHEAQSKLFGRVRLALIYSVLSTIMRTLTPVYRHVDIIAVAITIYFVCTIVHSIIMRDVTKRRLFHSGYILRSISRQSVLIVSATTAQYVNIQDAGTQSENIALLIFSTTAFLALLSLIPSWFIQDRAQGSLADLLIYSYMAMFRKVHIPGLHGHTGLGMLIYGILFIATTIISDPDHIHGPPVSKFRGILYNAFSIVFSTQFITQIIPAASSQVLPGAILLAMYIMSSHIPMSRSVAAFVLWQTADEISVWTTRMFHSHIIDKLMFFSLFLGVIPVLNHTTASIFAISAIQTSVAYIIQLFTYLGTTSAVFASIGLLLVTDILLDGIS